MTKSRLTSSCGRFFIDFPKGMLEDKSEAVINMVKSLKESLDNLSKGKRSLILPSDKGYSVGYNN